MIAIPADRRLNTSAADTPAIVRSMTHNVPSHEHGVHRRLAGVDRRPLGAVGWPGNLTECQVDKAHVLAACAMAGVSVYNTGVGLR